MRENRNLFWNLIYYFSATNIPLEFLVPYRDSSLYKHLPRMLDLRSKQTLLEQTRRYGLRYLDVFVTMRQKNIKQDQRASLESILSLRRVVSYDSVSGAAGGLGNTSTRFSEKMNSS